MNAILESLLEEGGVDDGAEGFRVSRHLQKLALAIATSRMTPSCGSANTHIKASGFRLGESVHSSNIIPSPITTPLGTSTIKPLFTNASEILREKGKRKKRQCRELVQRALVFHCYDAEEDNVKLATSDFFKQKR
jgi:hypothetical protein